MLADENIEEYVPVHEVGAVDEGEFVLRVKGDWMIDARDLRGRLRGRAPAEDGLDGWRWSAWPC